jgi:hypothetical protein
MWCRDGIGTVVIDACSDWRLSLRLALEARFNETAAVDSEIQTDYRGKIGGVD